MDSNIEEIEKLTKELNEIERSVLSEHTKDTAKELSNFIRTKQKVATLAEKQRVDRNEENFNSPIIKKELD